MFDTAELTGLDLVGQLRAAEATVAAAQAEQLAIIAELHTRSVGWIDAAPPGCPGLTPVELTAAEVSTALRWSTLVAADRVALAVTAAVRAPRALAALAEGRFTLTKLRRLLDRTVDLNADQVATVEDAVLDRATEQTPAQFTARLRRAVLRVDPAAAGRRAEAARRDRGVDLFPGEDGMAVLRAVLSAADALRCHQALTNTARARAETDAAAGVEDDRTMDARRADLLVDALLNPDPVGPAYTPAPGTGAGADASEEPRTRPDEPDPSATDTAAAHDRTSRPTDGASGPAVGTSAPTGGTGGPTGGTGGPVAKPSQTAPATSNPAGGTSAPTALRGRPSWPTAPTQVHVTVPWTVLAGLSDDPGELTGYGPIDDHTARALAAHDAVWRRILTDPATGAVLDVGATSYHPPAALEEFIRTRDRTCRFPGCRRTARRADLDHTIPHPDGPTSKANLAALCRPHHRLKTHTRWRVEQYDDGHLEWTSPTGLTHTTDPPPAHPPDKPDEPDNEAES